MNVGRQSLGLGGLFALLATVLTGCLAPLEPDELVRVDEAREEISTTSTESESADDQADRGSPSEMEDPPPETDDQPDPLPWTQLVPGLLGGCDPQARSGPDPLPWLPGAGTQSSPGTGSAQDKE